MSSEVLDRKKIKETMSKKDLVIEGINVEGYEKIVKVSHAPTGLLAIIAIHDTSLGTALGGTRIFSYRKFEDALTDVLRLSKGMTYKAAIAGVGLGGGKSVIIADQQKKNLELLMAFGDAVNSLSGLYICAEDVGCTLDDVMNIRKRTKYVVGLPHEKSSGDPSVFTAWGVLRGIMATLKRVFGSEEIRGKKIAIQGLGSVGLKLTNLLFWQGAELYITDINEEKAREVAQKYGANFVKPNDIYAVNCDLFSPCAMGGIINDQSLLQLHCGAIVGCANNQLLKEEHAEALHKKNILYAPDFVVNAGGLINVACELRKEGYNPKIAQTQTHEIYNALDAIYDISKNNNINTNLAAVELAKYRIKYGIGKREEKIHLHH